MTENQVATLSLVEYQINKAVTLDLSSISGEDFFEEVGLWLMQSIAHLHGECKARGIRPCIQLGTALIPQSEFITLLVGAFLDDLDGICH